MGEGGEGERGREKEGGGGGRGREEEGGREGGGGRKRLCVNRL